MRIASLASMFAIGALLAACSKPEPSAGAAPTPDVMAADSAKTTSDSMAMDSSMAKDSMKATMADSGAMMTDSTAMADTTKTN